MSDILLHFDVSIKVQPSLLPILPAAMLSKIVNDAADDHRAIVAATIEQGNGIDLQMGGDGAMFSTHHTIRVNGAERPFALVSVTTSIKWPDAFLETVACTIEEAQ